MNGRILPSFIDKDSQVFDIYYFKGNQKENKNTSLIIFFIVQWHIPGGFVNIKMLFESFAMCEIFYNLKFLRIFAFLLFMTFGCRNDNIEPGKTIILKDKPLSVIKANINGHWQVNYAIGGFSGRDRINYDNSYIDFKDNDSIYWIDNGKLIVNDTIKWVWDKDLVGDSTFIMNFYYSSSNYFYERLSVVGIFNDSLWLDENNYDSWGFNLTKK